MVAQSCDCITQLIDPYFQDYTIHGRSVALVAINGWAQQRWLPWMAWLNRGDPTGVTSGQ